MWRSSRERIAFYIIVSRAWFRSAIVPTSWFQCRLSLRRRSSSDKLIKHFTRTQLIPLEPRKFFSKKCFLRFSGPTQEAQFSVGNCWSSGQLANKHSTAVRALTLQVNFFLVLRHRLFVRDSRKVNSVCDAKVNGKVFRETSESR